MTLSVEAMTNAGNYTAALTPTSNYQWADGTTTAKSISWTIGKATPVVTAPKARSLTYTGSAQALVTARFHHWGNASVFYGRFRVFRNYPDRDGRGEL